jgi:hypothetical protein
MYPEMTVQLWIDSHLTPREEIEHIKSAVLEGGDVLDIRNSSFFGGTSNAWFPFYERLVKKESERAHRDSESPPFYYFVMMADICRMLVLYNFSIDPNNKGKAMLYCDDDIIQKIPVPSTLSLPHCFQAEGGESIEESVFFNINLLLAGYGNAVLPLLIRRMKKKLDTLSIILYTKEKFDLLDVRSDPAGNFQDMCGVFTGPFLLMSVLSELFGTKENSDHIQHLRDFYNMSKLLRKGPQLYNGPRNDYPYFYVNGMISQMNLLPFIGYGFSIDNAESYTAPLALFDIYNVNRYSQAQLDEADKCGI